MNNKTINPDLVREAKKIAYGDLADRLRRDFDMLNFPVDQIRLERALKEDFVFGWMARIDELDGSGFYASYYNEKSKRREQISDKSDTLLLLKCVSDMTGLPLYLEDKS